MTVKRSVEDLLSQATQRAVVHPADARAWAEYEKFVADGQRYFLKRLSPATDWLMRAIGDHDHRTYRVWRAGMMDREHVCVDSTVETMELNGSGDDAVLTIVMRDVGDHLVPPTEDIVPLEQHAAFIDHMAQLCCSLVGWQDNLGLTTMTQRLRLLSPENIAPELEGPVVPGPVAAAADGWSRLAQRAPSLERIARFIHSDPDWLIERLLQTPSSFLHGDWKLGNLGRHPDGEVILLDWTFPGAGPPIWDLCWYLALNRARMPESKEAAMARYRRALEQHGLNASAWWDEQLDLCLIGVMATFGWEKALGDDAELAWWDAVVGEAASRVGGVPTGSR